MGVRHGTVAACGGLILFVCGAALAAPPDAPEGERRGGDETRLPRPASPIVAAYPEGASGEAVVKVEVVVGVDGAVQSVRVVDGSPPFSTAAMAAVAAARFAPASRAGQAIAARFLLEVRVAKPAAIPPPAAPPAGTAAPAPAAAAPAGAAPTAAPSSAPAGPATPEQTAPPQPPPSAVWAAPVDVQVEGAKDAKPAAEPLGVHLSSTAVSRVPGAFGDAFRAVEILPGVVPFLSGLPYFFVRGAPPTGTGYFLDGIPVPLLFHVGVGPSVISPRTISSIDFYRGGYPVSFGRQVGGILAAETITPPPRFAAEATLSLLGVGAYVAAPLPADLGSVFASGRSSFTQAVLPLVTKEVNLGYWDYQSAVNLRLGGENRLRLFAFGADDFLTQRDGEREKTLYKGQFHRVDVAFEHGEKKPQRPLAGALFGAAAAPEPVEEEERPRMRAAATFGVDRTHIDGQGDLVGTLGQFRSIVELPLHRLLRVRAGLDVLVNEHRLDEAPPSQQPGGDDGSFTDAFPDRTVGTLGAYADAVLRPLPFADLTAGLRVDYFGDPMRDAAAVDPRALARIALFPWLQSVTAFGLAHQRPSFAVPVAGAAPADKLLYLQESVQLSESLELTLPYRISAQVTGYFHSYGNLTDFLATCSPEETKCSFYERAGGRSYGLELLLQRSLSERLGAQIAYTLSRSERTADGETFAADSDRTHVLHVVLGYEPAPGWHAGVRVTTYSGNPFSLVAHDNPFDPTQGTIVGKRNVPRRPGFFRLDLRLSKTWRIGSRGFFTAVLEGLNVTLSKETLYLDCRASLLPGSDCGLQEFGPVTIGNLGFTGGF